MHEILQFLKCTVIYNIKNYFIISRKKNLGLLQVESVTVSSSSSNKEYKKKIFGSNKKKVDKKKKKISKIKRSVRSKENFLRN